MHSSWIRTTLLATLAATAATRGADVRYLRPHADQGACEAVVVGDVPLVHTAQQLPLSAAGEVVGAGDVGGQAEQVLTNLEGVLSAAGSSLERLVKLNVYLAREGDAAGVAAVLARRFPTQQKPAVSYVVTRLPRAEVLVAMDAVATSGGAPARGVTLTSAPTSYPANGAPAAVLPPGTRIYVAGQAEKGATLAAATRQTLESLRNTLRFLGRREADIVQLKAFLSPMADVAAVQAEMASFFGEARLPPLVCVEWTAPLIEIELIAWGGNHHAGPPVEYLTPPGMTASPVYSRVARTHSAPLIYVGGLYGPADSDAAAETKDIFAQLGGLLTDAGSDLRHLVKATYYCATDDSSRRLNELRPNYYDAARPPSASKAMVTGVGRKGCSLTIDMIAVPAWTNAVAEYGPAEYGHGLTAEEARSGWLSLFDGKSPFGWSDAAIDDEGISAGTTTAAFGPCQVRIEVTRPGQLHKGARSYPLTPGTHELELDPAVAPLRLDAAVRVKHLQLRPVGLVSLLHGEDLTGWRRIDRETLPDSARPAWTVRDGRVAARGGPGALEYTEQRFGDFVLQLEVRTLVRHANGGVFVRSIPGDFMNGYEVQVYHRAQSGDPARPARYSTGAIDDRQLARRLVSRDDEPTSITVIARGPHLATWVNGVQLADWTDTRPAHDNPREGLRTAPGTIQLQAHDADTALEFSRIRIAELGGG